VVRNHEGGTRSAPAGDGPKAGPERDEPGVNSAIEYDEGAIFDNPKRGCPTFPRRAAGAGSVGKDGAKGQEGDRTHSLRCVFGPGGWSSKSPRAPRERNAVKVKEGGREAMRGDIPGCFPHGR